MNFWKKIPADVVILILALALLALALLTGCAARTQKSAATDTTQHDVFVVSATIPFPIVMPDLSVRLIDLPISGKMVRDSSTISKSEAESITRIQGPDIAGLVLAGIKQAFPLAGAFMGTPPPKDYTGEIVGGGTGVLGVIGLALKLRADAQRLEDSKAETEHHKADAAEGWKRFTDARAQPPTQSQG